MTRINKILILSSIPILLNAFDTSSLSNNFKNITGDISSLNKIKDFYSGGMSSVFSSLSGMAGAGGAVSSGMVSMCYDYKPAPVKGASSPISLNICNAIPNVKGDICSNAPDLSNLGYVKKTKNLNIDLKSYCNNLFGNNKTVTKVDFNTAQQNIDFDDSIIKTNDLTANSNVNSNSEDSSNKDDIYVTNYKSYDDASSPLNIKNIVANYTKTKNSSPVYEALVNNDYEAMQVYKQVINKTNNVATAKNSSFDKINTKYNSVKEYQDSLKKLRETLKTIEEQLSLSELAEASYASFVGINKQTTDAQERAKQKEAQRAKLLSDYKKILDKWAKIQEKVKILTEYKAQIVYPTKSFLSGYKSSDRAKAVFLVEKQKAEKVKLLNEIDERKISKLDDAKIVLHNELIRSKYFDEKLALQEINQLIGDNENEKKQ